MKKRLNENGFTLIELIIVIVILGIIATIAIPGVVSSIDDSRKSTDISNGKLIADAASRVLAGEGKYSGYEDTGVNLSTLNLTPNTTNNLYDDDFEADLSTMLNNDILLPKYKGTDVVEENFIVVISPGRLIKVYIGQGTDISSTNAVIIYPEPDSVYTN